MANNYSEMSGFSQVKDCEMQQKRYSPLGACTAVPAEPSNQMRTTSLWCPSLYRGQCVVPNEQFHIWALSATLHCFWNACSMMEHDESWPFGRQLNWTRNYASVEFARHSPTATYMRNIREFYFEKWLVVLPGVAFIKPHTVCKEVLFERSKSLRSSSCFFSPSLGISLP